MSKGLYTGRSDKYTTMIYLVAEVGLKYVDVFRTCCKHYKVKFNEINISDRGG